MVVVDITDSMSISHNKMRERKAFGGSRGRDGEESGRPTLG